MRIVVFDGKLPERSGSDIAGSLNAVVRSQRDRTEGGGHTGPFWCRDSCCVSSTALRVCQVICVNDLGLLLVLILVLNLV